MPTSTKASSVSITDQETVFEQQSKNRYSIKTSDGGRITTSLVEDESGDPSNPFQGTDLVLQKQFANGSFGPQVILAEVPFDGLVNYADVAIGGGGAAYVLDIGLDNGGFPQRTFELDLVDSAGQDTSLPLAQFSYEGAPGEVVASEPVLTHFSNSTLAVTWTEFMAADGSSPDAPPATASFARFYTDGGTLLNTSTVNFDGSSENDVYASNGTVTQRQIKSTSGSSDSRFFDAATGKETSETIRYADGSRTESNLAITGKSYLSQIATYDAAGKVVDLTRSYANGVTALSQHNTPDGSGHAVINDTSGRETTDIVTDADGSRTVVNSSYVGSSANPSSTQTYRYSSNNALQSVDTANANGSHIQVAYAPGVTLTATPMVADTLKSHAAGGDTFVFKPDFGQDLITNFHTGAGVAHDVADFSAFHLQLGSPQSQSDYLAQHLKQVGHDAVLTIAPNEVLTLKSTLVASLTRNNIVV